MKIKIIALGKIRENYLKVGIQEYLKRLAPYIPVMIVEISPIEIKDVNLTEKILNEHTDELHRVAQFLFEHEKMSGEQFIAAVENREIPIEVEVDDDDEDETDEHPISTSKELPSETPENADNTQNDNKDTDDEIVFHDVPKDDE